MMKRHNSKVRFYYPNPHHVELNLRSVHEPKNPSPSTLGNGEARQFWNDIFAQSEEIYGVHGKEHEIPEKTAWRAVRMNFEPQGKIWRPRKLPEFELPFILVNPGDTAWLGKLLEYVWVTPEGDVFQRKFSNNNPPDLWWNHKQKTLFSFPNLEIPQDMCLPIPDDMKDTAHIFKRWAQRDAKCNKEVTVPVLRMYPKGATDSVSYRSDKWHDSNPDIALKGSGEYIHVHGPQVWVWEDTKDLRKTPNVVAIRGGNLDVEERGIIH